MKIIVEFMGFRVKKKGKEVPLFVEKRGIFQLKK